MQRIGNVSEPEMYRTFNMGVGIVIVCAPQDADSIKSHLEQRGDPVYQIGQVTIGDKEVSIR